MSEKFDKLTSLLKELFQLDQPDLDFGLYRIMHAKAAEVTQFLDEDLLPQVKEAFSQYRTADKVELEKELAKVIAGVEAAGLNPDDSPKVKELRDRIKGDAVDVDALENEVYDHLFSFFRRYYSEGDFLAKRVYKPGVYAIPYEGEEVKLHWANRDQYYIKTSEYLRDYAFRLRPESEQAPMRVHFRLVDAAEGEHGNVKPANGNDRVFILAVESFIAEENGELVIFFEYRPATLTDWPDDAREGKTKPPTQKEMTPLAVKRLLETDAVFAPWIVELGKPHFATSGEKAEYTRVEAHLRRYTARNTFDYFVHKDLGGFLRRELDFYIKNEVMHLDDVENESAPRVEQYLSKIKVVRRIAGKIIDFLAQLEDFQKKLWLKQKFVVETNYCITLDNIPETFYSEIIANAAQREEWVRLFAIDEIVGDLTTPAYSAPVTLEFLRAHPTLTVDTRHFASHFTARLIEAMGDVDGLTDGVLVHSDNFQALSLMQARYRNQIKCIYIDPPYNTDGSPISYKNGYRSSSWVCLIEDRLLASVSFLTLDGVLCATIDDYQQKELSYLLESTFSRDQMLGTVTIRINPSGRITKDGLAVTHEYAFFVGASVQSALGRMPRSEEQVRRFKGGDDEGMFEWRNFRREGSSSERHARPRRYFPLYCAGKVVRVPTLDWDEDARSYKVLEQPKVGEVVCYPKDKNGAERVWRWGLERATANCEEIEARSGSLGGCQVYYKYRPGEEGILPPSMWVDAKYSATEHGTGALKKLFGARNTFSFPKSVFATADCVRIAGLEDEDGVVLDYFAGSGTTGHAAINLNREDGGERKFILIETGDYFETVLFPRIKKVAFTPEWKDGKPKRLATKEEAERSPRIVKVIRLESYEDALNSLETRRAPNQQSLLDAAGAQGKDGLKEQYLLRYVLDVETRGSQSLLNVQAFKDPTAYKLKVKRPGSDESREVNADLLETFNYLTGLTVQHIAAPQSFTAEFERDSEKRLRLKGRLKQDVPSADDKSPWWFRTVTGTTPDGRKTLVIWRKLTGNPEQDNLVLDEWFTKQGYSTKDYEFQLIYVNGDSNLENLKAPDDTWKVRLIEEDFHRLMFDTEGI